MGRRRGWAALRGILKENGEDRKMWGHRQEKESGRWPGQLRSVLARSEPTLQPVTVNFTSKAVLTQGARPVPWTSPALVPLPMGEGGQALGRAGEAFTEQEPSLADLSPRVLKEKVTGESKEEQRCNTPTRVKALGNEPQVQCKEPSPRPTRCLPMNITHLSLSIYIYHGN